MKNGVTTRVCFYIRHLQASLLRYMKTQGVRKLGVLHTADTSIRERFFKSDCIITRAGGSEIGNWIQDWRSHLDCPTLNAMDACNCPAAATAQGAAMWDRLRALVQGRCVVVPIKPVCRVRACAVCYGLVWLPFVLYVSVDAAADHCW